eukprot:g21035.t1
MVRYESVAIAALQLGKTLPPCFEPLRALLGGIFLCNYSVYCEMLAGFVTCEGRLDRCPLYGFVTKYAPRLVRQQLDSLQATLLTQPEAVQMADELQHQALALCMPEARNFRDSIGPGLPRSHELYRQLSQKHAGALNDAFFHYQKRLFEAEGDFDRAMSPDFETSTPPLDANSSWPDMQLDNITNAFFFPSCLLLGTRFLNTGSQNHSVRVAMPDLSDLTLFDEKPSLGLEASGPRSPLAAEAEGPISSESSPEDSDGDDGLVEFFPDSAPSQARRRSSCLGLNYFSCTFGF